MRGSREKRKYNTYRDFCCFYGLSAPIFPIFMRRRREKLTFLNKKCNPCKYLSGTKLFIIRRKGVRLNKCPEEEMVLKDTFRNPWKLNEWKPIRPKQRRRCSPSRTKHSVQSRSVAHRHNPIGCSRPTRRNCGVFLCGKRLLSAWGSCFLRWHSTSPPWHPYHQPRKAAVTS